MAAIGHLDASDINNVNFFGFAAPFKYYRHNSPTPMQDFACVSHSPGDRAVSRKSAKEHRYPLEERRSRLRSSQP